MKKPFVIVLTGASSVGKTPIKEALLNDKELDLHYTISVTTRPKREDEVDGKDYFFISIKEFKEMVHNKQLCEFTNFGGYYYGIPKQQIDMLKSLNKNILIDTEVQGVGQAKLYLPEAVCVFIEPESFETLKCQIEDKYKDSQTLHERLNKAKCEMDLLSLFRHVVSVCDTNKAVADIKGFIAKEVK